jgi:hypothetical protein
MEGERLFFEKSGNGAGELSDRGMTIVRPRRQPTAPSHYYTALPERFLHFPRHIWIATGIYMKIKAPRKTDMTISTPESRLACRKLAKIYRATGT